MTLRGGFIAALMTLAAGVGIAAFVFVVVGVGAVSPTGPSVQVYFVDEGRIVKAVEQGNETIRLYGGHVEAHAQGASYDSGDDLRMTQEGADCAVGEPGAPDPVADVCYATTGAVPGLFAFVDAPPSGGADELRTGTLCVVADGVMHDPLIYTLPGTVMSGAAAARLSDDCPVFGS